MQTTYTWKTNDALAIFGQSWTPVESPKAVLALVHGMGEHSSRYEALANFLNNHGIAVMTFDLRGHGKSEGKRGHSPNYDALMEDISIFLKEVSATFPNLPIVLMGHSLGGNLVLNHALRRTPAVRGVIASAPWLRLAFEPPKFKLFLANTVGKLLSGMQQSSELDVNAISRDPEEVRKYTNDPLVHDKITPGMFLGAYNAGIYALQNAKLFKYPLLIYHGTADRITSCDASKQFAMQHGGDVTWKSWPGFFHESHNEPEKEQVYQLLVDWVEGLI